MGLFVMFTALALTRVAVLRIGLKPPIYTQTRSVISGLVTQSFGSVGVASGSVSVAGNYYTAVNRPCNIA